MIGLNESNNNDQQNQSFPSQNKQTRNEKQFLHNEFATETELLISTEVEEKGPSVERTTSEQNPNAETDAEYWAENEVEQEIVNHESNNEFSHTVCGKHSEIF